MSGHSKWSSIKHKKGALDAKRGKIFTKIGHEITIAARSGANPDENPTLRMVIQKARSVNMPQANIQRGIDRATGAGKDAAIEAFYEGYGPQNIAVIVQVLTDNKNRTNSEIRNLFDKNGGKLAGENAVKWMFEQKGVIKLAKTELSEDEEMKIIDSGADDYFVEDRIVLVYTQPQDLMSVKKSFEDSGFETTDAELSYEPKEMAEIPEDKKEVVMRFLETLDDHEEVVKIFTNANL